MLETRKERKRLNDVIPNWLTGEGMMVTLTTNFNVPWKDAYTGEELSLDIAYHGGHSGQKLIAPLLENFISDTQPTIKPEDQIKIASALWATYRRKWEKLWDLYMDDYDPLSNYDVYEEVDEAIQSTGTKTGTVSTSSTDTFNKTDTTSQTGTLTKESLETQDRADETTKTGTIQSTGSTEYGKISTQSDSGTQETTETERRNLEDNRQFDESAIKSGNYNDNTMDSRNITTETLNRATGSSLTTVDMAKELAKDLNTHEVVDASGSTTDDLFGFNSQTSVPSESGTSANNTVTDKDETGTETESTDGTTKLDKLDVFDGRVDTNDYTEIGRTVTYNDLMDRKSGTETKTYGGMNSIAKLRVDDLESLTRLSGSDTTSDTTTNNLVDKTEYTGTVDTETTETRNLTDTAQQTGTIGTDGTTTNDLSNTDDADRTLSGHKYGNIGVSSIQRMFREEVENWRWNYMRDVFMDIDSLLVLAVN